MEIQHDLIIHLINVISGKDQHIFRMKGLHILQILVNCIGSAGIPLAVHVFLIGRKYGHPA